MTLHFDAELKTILDERGLQRFWMAVQQRPYPNLWAKAAAFILAFPIYWRSDSAILTASRMVSDAWNRLPKAYGDLRLRLSTLKPNIADLLAREEMNAAAAAAQGDRAIINAAPISLQDFLKKNPHARELLKVHGKKDVSGDSPPHANPSPPPPRKMVISRYVSRKQSSTGARRKSQGQTVDLTEEVAATTSSPSPTPTTTPTPTPTTTPAPVPATTPEPSAPQCIYVVLPMLAPRPAVPAQNSTPSPQQAAGGPDDDTCKDVKPQDS